jgi:hypothetical protein
MAHKMALERWETKVGNTEATPQTFWPLVKSLLKRNGPGPSGLRFNPSGKANATADCSENQFTHHDLCDENHEWRVEATVKALLEALDYKPLKE